MELVTCAMRFILDRVSMTTSQCQNRTATVSSFFVCGLCLTSRMGIIGLDFFLEFSRSSLTRSFFFFFFFFFLGGGGRNSS